MRLEALAESTGTTLVPVRLVYRTQGVQVRLSFARVHAVTVDAPLEEPGAACK